MAAGMLVEGGQRMFFWHPLIRQALHDGIPVCVTSQEIDPGRTRTCLGGVGCEGQVGAELLARTGRERGRQSQHLLRIPCAARRAGLIAPRRVPEICHAERGGRYPSGDCTTAAAAPRGGAPAALCTGCRSGARRGPGEAAGGLVHPRLQAEAGPRRRAHARLVRDPAGSANPATGPGPAAIRAGRRRPVATSRRRPDARAGLWRGGRPRSVANGSPRDPLLVSGTPRRGQAGSRSVPAPSDKRASAQPGHRLLQVQSPDAYLSTSRSAHHG